MMEINIDDRNIQNFIKHIEREEAKGSSLTYPEDEAGDIDLLVSRLLDGWDDDEASDDVRSHNVGTSDYSEHDIQPWDIILEYDLNFFDGDIIKRVLRTKEGTPRVEDYEKIIHVCQERIRQIETE